LNGDWVVDFKDFAMFAAQWRQTGKAEQDVQLSFVWDANIGLAEFSASGWTEDTQRIFLLIDGQYAGEVPRPGEESSLGVDISELGSGEHQLKAVSIDSGDKVTCSNVTKTEFACPLNYCMMPSEYEPNKPMHFSAFNTAGGNVTVNAYADMNVVWSQTYNEDSIIGSIPAGITRQYDFDYINFDTGGGTSIFKMSAATDAEGPYAGDYQALIILPDEKLSRYGVRETIAVWKAFENRGIRFKKLVIGNATYKNVKEYSEYNPIKYMYILAHGHFFLEGDNGALILRTSVDLSDGQVFSIKKSDFPYGGAPEWCEELGFWEERDAKTFYSMNFTNLEFAYFDCCFSGLLRINSLGELIVGQPGQEGLFDIPHSDMSFALGMMCGPLCNRFYQGWYGKPDLNPPDEPETAYQKWTQDEWNELGKGEGLYWALMYAIFWQTEAGPEDPMNNFRVKGQGDPHNLFLSND
jgi:hypothetical protein